LSNGVLSVLAAKLSEHGYRQREQSFWKEMGTYRLLFHVSLVRHRDEIDIIADVAVRHHAVEDLLNSHRSDLRPRERKLTATIGVELGNWINGRPQCWTVGASAEIDSVATDIFAWFQRFGVPFLERFSSLKEVFEVLDQNGAEARLICPLTDHRRQTCAAVQDVLEAQSNKLQQTRAAQPDGKREPAGSGPRG
jgi:hypothetical protein